MKSTSCEHRLEARQSTESRADSGAFFQSGRVGSSTARSWADSRGHPAACGGGSTRSLWRPRSSRHRQPQKFAAATEIRRRMLQLPWAARSFSRQHSQGPNVVSANKESESRTNHTAVACSYLAGGGCSKFCLNLPGLEGDKGETGRSRAPAQSTPRAATLRHCGRPDPAAQ